VAGDTVARRPGHTQLTCGNRIVVQGNGCRTVQDEGGGLTPTQIDMYQGVGAAVCAGWTNPTRKVIAIR
jgi:3D (Asp-Asp-Asp) domain-containing protein